MLEQQQVLALDLSTRTGWALLGDSPGQAQPSLLCYGNLIQLSNPNKTYPWSYWYRAEGVGDKVKLLVENLQPDTIVIEEINKGKNRYSQKVLDFIHKCVLDRTFGIKARVVYVNSSDWRAKLNLHLTGMDKKKNAILSTAKRSGQKIDRKTLGIRGKITKKHLAIRYVQSAYGIDLQVQENDIAEAICLGVAFCSGVSLCDGT